MDHLLQNEDNKAGASAMTITEYLHYLNDQNIDITSDYGQLLIGNTSAITVPNFNHLKNRLQNNLFMKSRGWLVANYGEVYSYQYSARGYYYIERNLDETVNIYRCRFDKDGKVTAIKGWHESIPFSEAYHIKYNLF